MRNRLALHIALVLGTGIPLAAFAQAATPHTIAIAPMPLSKALQNFSHEAGLQIVYGSEIADSIRSPGADAGITPEQQLRQLLTGTGLTYRFVTPNTVTIVPGNVATNAGSPASAAVTTAGSAGAGKNSNNAASSQSDKTAKDLDRVVVTARSGVDVRTRAQTSYSITTIDEDRLRMQGPTSVTEALKSVPGFWVEASGGEASGNIRARGIPVDGYGSVNLLEDGIPVQHDPALGYLNADQVFRLDETIERIEVVRGGPSSIFYSNAPAGAINFIPRQVDDMAEGLIKYTAGNYGLGRLDFWYGTPIGDGWKFSTGGFFRIDHNIRNPGYNGDNGGQLRATLSKQFENGDISFDVKRLDDRVYFDLGIPMYRNTSGDLVSVPGFNGNYGTVAGPETEHMELQQGNGSYYNFDNSLGTDVKRTQLTLKFDYNLWDDWKLAEDVRYSATNTIRNGVYPNSIETAAAFYASAESHLKQYYPNAAGMQLQYVDSGAAFGPNQNGNGLVMLGGLRGITMPVNEITSDTRLLRKFEFGDQTHDVTLGYYHAYFNQSFDRYSSTVLLDTSDNAKLLNLVAVNAAGQTIGSLTDGGIYNNGYEWAHAHGTSDTDAFYASDEWQINDKLRIDGGARWERVNTTGWTELPTTVNLGTPWSAAIITGSGQYASYDHSFNKLGWTLGANYQFSDHQGVFARYTSTFRLPNLSTYITTPTAVPVTQTMVLPEIGYKFANRYIETYETLFYTKYNNVGFSNYVFNPTSGASTAETGYADTETFGLELEGTIYPCKWFDLQYSATLQDPRYKGLRYTTIQAGEPVLLDYDDNQLIRVPRKSLRLVPGVNLLNNKLRLQMTYEYEGKRYSDTANSVELPQYYTLGFSARYQASPNLTFFVYADNLNNSLGLTEGNPRSGELKSSDAGATVFIARPLLGRSFRASVMYQF
ncbi:TonB-dependent receptor domain-containing protein [Dyella nitratireducens]|uniref:TonB-dependent receptor n=1 Tax=Dyella nitratireducens TaxID=1849580 RepID=A0ABQ1FU87_9GAMM|nr:TonB-dependent receptor [Dyella nitratireducens]GGA30174.1 TonB-dependent receptor [Dyella nitratireducens]GLQ43040.1 TonB-dependent receptor [Dyella nitratireducens]